MARTEAGTVIEQIMRAYDIHGSIPGTFIEGEKDTASVWIQDEETKKYFQVHVTELDPTEADLDFYRRGGTR